MQSFSLRTLPIAAFAIVFFFLFVAFAVRVSNLEKKFYWIDEVSSSFVITGHWSEDIERESGKFSGQVISIGRYQRFLEEDPNLSTVRLVSDLAKRDPQHSPLYYILAQKWAAVFGSRPSSLRMISVLLSFIGIPVFAWLCVELFESAFFGVVGLAVTSFAPFLILFSQQNREYGFWFSVCALSTVLLLLANRINRSRYWVAYGLSVSICLYTFLFSVPFLCSHILFQWWEKKSIKDTRFIIFTFSSIAGFTLYVPWLANILLKRGMVEDLNKWSSVYLEPSLYVQSFLLNLSRLFVDFNLPSFKPLPWDRPFLLVPIILATIGVMVAFFVLAKNLSRSRCVLVLSSFGIPILFLLAMDLFKGHGIHALVGRQLMPAWLAVYLAVTFSIGVGLRSSQSFNRLLAASLGTAVLMSGTWFSVSYVPTRHWWPLRSKGIFEDADLIESSKAGLVVTPQSISTKQFLSLSYSLNRNLPLLILKDHQAIRDVSKTRTIALYRPNDWILKDARVDFVLQKVSADLWIGHPKGN